MTGIGDRSALALTGSRVRADLHEHGYDLCGLPYDPPVRARREQEPHTTRTTGQTPPRRETT